MKYSVDFHSSFLFFSLSEVNSSWNEKEKGIWGKEHQKKRTKMIIVIIIQQKREPKRKVMLFFALRNFISPIEEKEETELKKY